MPVTVIDPLPMYRQGMVAVLSAAGHKVRVIDDPVKWQDRELAGLVLLTLQSDPDWDLLGQLREGLVIAVVAPEAARLGAQAVRAGARSVLERDVSATVLLSTVAATLAGQAVMPAAVATALAAGARGDAAPPAQLSAHQLTWLKHLATGMTVAQLARQAGYSERAMFRLLHGLYRQLGVRTRIEAVVRAQQEGWWDTNQPSAF
ncbi:DNA-binding response regulator [Actinoplanes sp. NPDC020271]|uniref:DNA-binding response regulator n=1 Tax=Actinoplanes sp. NPDC020271 TaxID=3363896 RepID=UPI0037AF5443